MNTCLRCEDEAVGTARMLAVCLLALALLVAAPRLIFGPRDLFIPVLVFIGGAWAFGHTAYARLTPFVNILLLATAAGRIIWLLLRYGGTENLKGTLLFVGDGAVVASSICIFVLLMSHYLPDARTELRGGAS